MFKKSSMSSMSSMTSSLASRLTSPTSRGNASGSVSLNNIDAQSVTEAGSQTEEVHEMTKEELNYVPCEEEQEFLEEVSRELRKRLVNGEPSTSFGLKWKLGGVNEDVFVIGGWLSQVSRSMLSSTVVNGSLRFCVLDDASRTFRQCLDEHQKTRRSLNYDDITTVRPRYQKSGKGGSTGGTWYLQIFGKKVRWELMCVSPTDRDTLLRWTCVLQHRTGTYDSALEYDASRARKVAIWLQSIHRMRKAQKRAQRRREKRDALLNRLKTAVGLSGWDAGDSDDEEDEGEGGWGDAGGAVGYVYQFVDMGSNAVSSALSTVGSWLGLGGAAPLLEDQEAEEEATVGKGGSINSAQASALSKEEAEERERRRNSTFVQFSNELPPLGPDEAEDEVWENQRWDPANGWSCRTLNSAAERAPFTDRLGRGNYINPLKKPEKPLKPGECIGIPLPPSGNWKPVTELYLVDTSGLTKGRCDKEGWTYATDWRVLDSDLAKGKYVGHNPGGLAGYVVRRRRLYRRRRFVPASSSARLESSISPILLQGWLGCKSEWTGRWQSRYYVLTRPGLAIGTVPSTLESKNAAVLRAPRGPILTYFRLSFRDYERVVADGGMDPVPWKELTPKLAVSIELDPRLVSVDESVATPARPGYFRLVFRANPLTGAGSGVHLSSSNTSSGTSKARTFCASDAMARQSWALVIGSAVRDALKTNRPRTLRLVGGAFETTSYPTIVMDSILLAPVDAVEEAAFQSPSVFAAIAVRMGAKNVSPGDWHRTNGARVVTYDDDKRNGRVVETWTRARTQPGVGFVVDRHISAPNVQFGGDFNVKVRTVLVAAEVGEGADKRAGCRVIVSIDYEFLNQTMMVGYITSTGRREVTAYYEELWFPAVLGFLSAKGLIPKQLVDNSTKFSKQRSGNIDVKQI